MSSAVFSFVLGLAAAIGVNAGPLGIGIMILVLLDKRGRFSLSMMMALTAFVALTCWSTTWLWRN